MDIKDRDQYGNLINLRKGGNDLVEAIVGYYKSVQRLGDKVDDSGNLIGDVSVFDPVIKQRSKELMRWSKTDLAEQVATTFTSSDANALLGVLQDAALQDADDGASVKLANLTLGPPSQRKTAEVYRACYKAAYDRFIAQGIPKKKAMEMANDELERKHGYHYTGLTAQYDALKFGK